jgi:predicted nuclease of restriction endonuclease-like (RecB) superfamily
MKPTKARKRVKPPTPPVHLADGRMDLFERVRAIWEESRTQAARSVNIAHVCANWLIGREIVEEEQLGKDRADYGAELLRTLSTHMTKAYGTGFSVSALQYMRVFYLTYPKLLEKQHAVRVEFSNTLPESALQISHALRDQLTSPQEKAWQTGQLHDRLSWMHYRTLLRVEREDVRAFYEIEAIHKGWSGRQLERQINSLLFERLLKSRDKSGVLDLANKGLIVEKPVDALKDPYVLEFLNLPESERLNETRIEQALIGQLQAFLLELGQGFAFVDRQKRLTLEADHFYPDLVFYHIKLLCYVIIDLKTGKLTHADLGQMQMYVNYYDREIAGADDNPTIGLILCTDKNDAMVRYVLDKKRRQIFASRYQTHLPTEEALRAELRRELNRLALPEEGGKA